MQEGEFTDKQSISEEETEKLDSSISTPDLKTRAISNQEFFSTEEFFVNCKKWMQMLDLRFPKNWVIDPRDCELVLT